MKTNGKKKNSIIFVSLLALALLSIFVISQQSTPTLSVKQGEFIKTVRNSGIEGLLFNNITHYKEGTSLIINADVNLTVYNFLKDTHRDWDSLTNAQKKNKCLVIQNAIQEDFPNFDCTNPAHRTELKNRLNGYIGTGWQLFQNGMDRGFIDVTKGHITITIPNIQHRDRIKLGQFSLVTEYQDINLINYQLGWADVNITLFINESGWNSTANDVWIRSGNKFGANVSKTQDTYFKYFVESSSLIKKGKGFKYYISERTPSKCGDISCFNEERHEIDFKDICGLIQNKTVIDLTMEDGVVVKGFDNGIIFDPQCKFNQIDSNTLEVEFWGRYNSSLGFIEVDPTITITDVSVSASILTNITVQNNFSHINMSTTAPYDNLILYVSFDTNTTSTTVYDYSANGNDGTADGTWNSNGVYGGSMDFERGLNQEIDFGDIGALDGVNKVTYMGWAKKRDPNDRVYLYSKNLDNLRRISVAWLQDGTVYFIVRNTLAQSGTVKIANDTEWHHFAMVFDGTASGNSNRQKGFIDGVEQTLTYGGTLPTTTPNAGRLTVTEQDQFSLWGNQSVDELMVFDDALTNAEIIDIYNNQSIKFLSRAEQEFQNNNVSSDGTETFINITINSSMNFDSMINVTVGNVSGSGYDFGAEYAFTNNFVSDIPIGTPNNISLKFIFYPGNNTNPFISPTLENNIVIDSFATVAAGTVFSVNITQQMNSNDGIAKIQQGNRDVTISIIFNSITSRLYEGFVSINQQLNLNSIISKFKLIKTLITQQIKINFETTKSSLFNRSTTLSITINTVVERMSSLFIRIIQFFKAFFTATIPTIADVLPPIIVLNSPANDSDFTVDIFNITLNATVTDDKNNIDVLIYGVDNNPQTGNISQLQIGDISHEIKSTANTIVAQNITLNSRGVKSLSFKLRKVTAPVGDVNFVIIRTLDNSRIQNKTWGDASTLTTTPTWETVTFNNVININESVYVGVEFNGGDISNYVLISANGSDPLAGSTLAEYDGSIWTETSGTDLTFEINYTDKEPDALLYKALNQSNNTDHIYNWTAPVTEKDEYSLLLMHMDNNSDFGENQTLIYDFSGNNNNGTFIGDTIFNKTSKFGWGVELDGVGDYVEIPDGAYANGTFTVALWFKVNTFQTGGSGSNMDLYSDGGEKNIDINSVNKVVKGFNNNKALTGSTTLTEDVWYHVAFTGNDTTRFLYLNGAEEANDTNVSTVADISSVIRIGDNPSLTRDFNGTIDEVAVWNRTLNSTEIKDLYRLKNGTYFWKVNATDTSTNRNSNESETRQFTINVASVASGALFSANATLQLTFTESIARLHKGFLAISQNLNIQSLILRGGYLIKSITDQININAFVTKSLKLFRNLVDLFNMESLRNMFANIFRTTTQQINISDSLNTVRGFLANVVDSLNINSSIERLSELFRAIVQQIKIILSLSTQGPPLAAVNASAVGQIIPNTGVVPYIELNQTLVFG